MRSSISLECSSWSTQACSYIESQVDIARGYYKLPGVILYNKLDELVDQNNEVNCECDCLFGLFCCVLYQW